MVDSEANSPTWKFTQCFGDKGDVEDITEADIISTVEFDHTGNYLATGDKGGRVVLFERNETVRHHPATCSCTDHDRLGDSVASSLIITCAEKNLRVQVPHRVPISRARIRLSKVTRDRGKDQQDKVVQTTERLALSPVYQ
jgi:hypothetical protein